MCVIHQFCCRILFYYEMNKTTSLSKGHVHFGPASTAPRENAVLIQENNPGCIHIHLGFLQFQHNYKITLDVPKEYFLGRCLNALLEGAEGSIPNINCKLVSIEEKAKHFHMIVEFSARKEKLLKEELIFKFGDEKIILVFIARVLGEGKGTPLLKNEIKCIGAEVDEMSETSDWSGFD